MGVGLGEGGENWPGTLVISNSLNLGSRHDPGVSLEAEVWSQVFKNFFKRFLKPFKKHLVDYHARTLSQVVISITLSHFAF